MSWPFNGMGGPPMPAARPQAQSQPVEIAVSPVAWLPSVLTVVGWWLVGRQANNREIRKERRGLLDASKKLVVDQAKAARDYMLVSKQDEATEADIKLGLDQLEIELMRLTGYKEREPLVRAMANFSDAATGGGFESKEKLAVPLGHADQQKLTIARNDLLKELEAWFASFYG